jgi:hypothetical protein
MAGWQDLNGSMGQTVTSGIAHNISSSEEKVNPLKRERSMDEDLSVLSIRSVSSIVGRTLFAGVKDVILETCRDVKATLSAEARQRQTERQRKLFEIPSVNRRQTNGRFERGSGRKGSKSESDETINS